MLGIPSECVCQEFARSVLKKDVRALTTASCPFMSMFFRLCSFFHQIIITGYLITNTFKYSRSVSSMNRVTNDYTGGGIKTDSMFANLLNRGSQLFMEGVKNLVPRKHNLPLTKVVKVYCRKTQFDDNCYSAHM